MTTRRKFLQYTGGAIAGAAFSASSYSRILGANDRLNVGVMGLRSRGIAVMDAFLATDNCTVSHICDVDRRLLKEVSNQLTLKGQQAPKQNEDVRRILEDPELDALIIATPDHWHAPASIMAMQAGKHVYVEKPCSHNPREGELLIDAQKKHGKVVQMGNQQRSSKETIELISRINDGQLGDIYRAYTWYANARGSIGNGQKVAAPDWLNWDLWQGPAPRRSFYDNYVHYNWHWFWHWGTAESSNNGAHELDIARWAMGVDFPEQVSTVASRRFHTDDDWEMYDTMEATFRFPDDKFIVWEGHSCNNVKRFGRGRGTLIYGTKGSAIVDREGYELYDIKGKLLHSKVAKAKKSATADLIGADQLTNYHASNFVDTLRGKTHNPSPIDEGHKSTLMCQLANISYRTSSTLACSTTTGRVKTQSAQNLWGRDYEPGWELTI